MADYWQSSVQRGGLLRRGYGVAGSAFSAADYCVESIVWRDSVQRGGLLAGAAHPRRQKHREMPPPGASAPAFAAAVEPACAQDAAGGRIFLAAATTAGGLFFFAATKIRIGRIPLLRQGQVPLRRLFT